MLQQENALTFRVCRETSGTLLHAPILTVLEIPCKKKCGSVTLGLLATNTCAPGECVLGITCQADGRGRTVYRLIWYHDTVVVCSSLIL